MMRKRMVRMVCSRWVHVRFREIGTEMLAHDIFLDK